MACYSESFCSSIASLEFSSPFQPAAARLWHVSPHLTQASKGVDAECRNSAECLATKCVGVTTDAVGMCKVCKTLGQLAAHSFSHLSQQHPPESAYCHLNTLYLRQRATTSSKMGTRLTSIAAAAPASGVP
jgi:hypothetical protein